MSIIRKTKKLVSASRHKEFRRGLFCGVAPAIEHDALLRSLPTLSSIVDVGANRGQFALVARRIHPTAKIIAFEPLSTPGLRFSRVFCRDSNVTLHSLAIGKSSAEAEFHVSASDDSSSLLPISNLQEATFPGTKQRRVERVQVRRLSEVVDPSDLRAPALIKIDVQGAELEVLLGVGELLALIDYVCVEASFVEFYSGQPLANEILSYMSDCNFTLSGVYNAVLDKQGRSVQADFVFRNNRLLTVEPASTSEQHRS